MGDYGQSNENVATFIKELILELPEGEKVGFDAGGYVQMEIPAYEADYKSFEIETEYLDDWEKFKVLENKSAVNCLLYTSPSPRD